MSNTNLNNNGTETREVSEEELLDSWKEFFSTGTNWKDLDTGITYEKYCSISDAFSGLHITWKCISLMTKR